MATLPRISLTIPTQPPIGSVVLDAQGRAWQRLTDGRWHTPGEGDAHGTAWAELLAAQRDVVLLHTPGAGDSTDHQPQADDDPHVLVEWDRENNRWIRLQDGWWRVEDDPLAPRYRTRQDLAAGRGPMRTAKPS